jgi:hypothetical protein
VRWDDGSVGLMSWLFGLSVGLLDVEEEDETKLVGEEGRGLYTWRGFGLEDC